MYKREPAGRSSDGAKTDLMALLYRVKNAGGPAQLLASLAPSPHQPAVTALTQQRVGSIQGGALNRCSGIS